MSSKSKEKSISQIVNEIQERSGIVGRTKELRQIVLARLSSRHVVIEGTVGVGKTTLAQAVANYFDQGFIRIDGDERYTEAKLVGHFEPPLVVKNGWTRDSFVGGPLTKAMENGSVLFINEANRLIEGTQNVLLPALDEGIVTLPKLSPVLAKDGFFVVATQNPESYIGTTVLSEALKDRFVWVKLDRQTYDDELSIVMHAAQVKNKLKIAEIATKVCRSTRGHAEIRRGASVRGAIDFAKILNLIDDLSIENVLEIAIMSLATKIELEDGVDRTIEEVIEEVLEKVMSGEEEEFF
ncbi:MAG: Denitrification regulatory protein NirQ [Candidatus Heimdallarchaeota archaeon LC_3]|nr:MAG: Denitrification regulatory protein NirQ [Candidatus Heimdallarchaeota archaeon LC_3]